MAKAGQPTKFNEKVKKQILCMALKAFTDVEMSNILSIDESTLTHWKKKYPKFFTSVKDAKAEADKNVVKSLYQRACGFACPAEKRTVVVDGVERTEMITKFYPPDPTSMIFWLKNRDRANWRDKQDVAVSGDLTVNVVKFGKIDDDIGKKKDGPET